MVTSAAEPIRIAGAMPVRSRLSSELVCGAQKSSALTMVSPAELQNVQPRCVCKFW